MGHYRSEMGYEAEDAELASRHENRMTKMAEAIEADVKKRGIGRVLAEILDSPIHYKIGKY